MRLRASRIASHCTMSFPGARCVRNGPVRRRWRAIYCCPIPRKRQLMSRERRAAFLLLRHGRWRIQATMDGDVHIPPTVAHMGKVGEVDARSNSSARKCSLPFSHGFPGRGAWPAITRTDWPGVEVHYQSRVPSGRSPVQERCDDE